MGQTAFLQKRRVCGRAHPHISEGLTCTVFVKKQQEKKNLSLSLLLIIYQMQHLNLRQINADHRRGVPPNAALNN